MSPMWKKLMKMVDPGEPTSFLECKPNETISDEYRKMFESRTSAGTTEELLGSYKLHAITVVWSYDMVGRTKKYVETNCENR